MAKPLCPREIESLLQEAEVNHHDEKYEEAIKLLQEAIQSCPGNALAHNNLGAALTNSEDLKRPKGNFVKLLNCPCQIPMLNCHLRMLSGTSVKRQVTHFAMVIF